MAGLAEFESSLIGDRVRAGMARARAEGKHVGRAALNNTIIAQIVRLSPLDKKEGQLRSFNTSCACREVS